MKKWVKSEFITEQLEKEQNAYGYQNWISFFTLLAFVFLLKYFKLLLVGSVVGKVILGLQVCLYYTCECVDMQDVCLSKCTCLLAVQNFFWKNSSFIWMPTAERKTTHSLTRSNSTCVWSVCWSASALWSLSNRSYPTGKREIVDIHTESKCIFH